MKRSSRVGNSICWLKYSTSMLQLFPRTLSGLPFASFECIFSCIATPVHSHLRSSLTSRHRSFKRLLCRCQVTSEKRRRTQRRTADKVFGNSCKGSRGKARSAATGMVPPQAKERISVGRYRKLRPRPGRPRLDVRFPACANYFLAYAGLPWV